MSSALLFRVMHQSGLPAAENDLIERELEEGTRLE